MQAVGHRAGAPFASLGYDRVPLLGVFSRVSARGLRIGLAAGSQLKSYRKYAALLRLAGLLSATLIEGYQREIGNEYAVQIYVFYR